MRTDLNKLWDYQQQDMEADAYEKKIRTDPERVELLKQRDYLINQQSNMKKINSQIEAMVNGYKTMDEELQSLFEDLEELSGMDEPETLKMTRHHIQMTQKLINALAKYEQELQRMRKDIEHKERQIRNIRVNAAKVRQQYDVLREEYNKTYKEQKSNLDKLRQKTKDMGNNIPQELLNKYTAIKKHSTPPMAEMDNDRCGGCNMSLPSVKLRAMRAGEGIVECENCMRIIYTKY